MIEIKKLGKQFQNETEIEYQDMIFETGKSYMLLGASGCGKSTLLNMIAGIISPTKGSITIDGVEYTKDNTSADNPAVIKSDSVVVITVYGVDVGNEDLICKLEYRSGADNPIHENWLWVFNEDNTQATWTISGDYFISQTTVFELRYSTYMYNYKASGVYIIYEAGDSR